MDRAAPGHRSRPARKRHTDDDLKASIPDVPWEDIIGMRIVLHHRYHAIDHDTLWNGLEVDIPALAAALRTAVESNG